MTERRKRTCTIVELPPDLHLAVREQARRYRISVQDIIVSGTREMVERMKRERPILPEPENMILKPE